MSLLSQDRKLDHRPDLIERQALLTARFSGEEPTRFHSHPSPSAARPMLEFLGVLMEVGQLRAILALRDSASLTEAGTHLHLSPSAVFWRVRQLEEELGKKLYQHAGKQLRLTRAGEKLADEAQKIIEAHDTVLTSFRESATARRPILRIGCGPYGSAAVVPHLLRAVLAEHPTTEVHLTSADDLCLLNGLRVGTIDVILMSLPMNEAELFEEPLWSYEQVFIFPPSLYLEEGNGTFAHLKEQAFIRYRRGPVVETSFHELCDDLGFEPNVVMENDGVDSIKEFVRLGVGISFLPLWAVGEESHQGTLRILYPPTRRLRNYGLICRSSGLKPTAVANLWEIAHRWRQWWPSAPYAQAPLPQS